MSEQTGDGKAQPDPGEDQVQDQPTESVFNDPTAPVWADPNAPIPATPAAEVPSAQVQDAPEVPLVPPAAPGAAYPYGQQPSAPPASPPAAPPVSNPYAQQPPAQSYGQPTPYGQPTYGLPQPGEQYPSYGQQSYATGATSTPSNASAIVLTILSGISVLTCNILAIGSLVFGIMALTKNATDPEGSRRMSKIGWIVFASAWGLAILGIIGYLVFVVALVSNGGTSTFN